MVDTKKTPSEVELKYTFTLSIRMADLPLINDEPIPVGKVQEIFAEVERQKAGTIAMTNAKLRDALVKRLVQYCRENQCND